MEKKFASIRTNSKECIKKSILFVNLVNKAQIIKVLTVKYKTK